jgi:cysteine desulfurase/selenocysteine lyase
MAAETEQAVRPALDVARLRADFPILGREIHGHPLAYLDSASSTQKPQAVIDSLVDTFSNSYANVHRGVYTLAEETTARYEGARETVRAFLGAASTREVIFVRDTTEGLNLVAYAWGRKHLRAGDVIVATEMEHHSNLVPWQFLANQTGALMRYVKVDEEGALDLQSLERAAADGPVRLVAAVHVSNSLGTVNPIAELGAWCRAHDAVLVVDGAQSAPHRPVDVQALGCDFFAFSGHKLGGPGSGALYGREERLREMDPFLTGGEMISRVTLDKGTSWNDLPYKFEAGTPAIAENIALGVAIDYLTGVGLEAVARHERELTAYAYERLSSVPDLRILGPGPGVDRGGVLSFALPDIHPHDLAAELDLLGIAVRAGHHCTQPAMRLFGVPATTRASFWLYSLPEEVDRLVDGLEHARKAFA